MGYAKLQPEPLDAARILAELGGPRTGGITLYVGTVRGDDDGRRVDTLEYEAYSEMAQDALERLRADIVARHALEDAIVVHRTGRVKAGEPTLVVALAGRHRKETFRAVDEFMDRLKRDVPVWKKESSPSGTAWIVGDGPGRRRL